MNSLTGEVAQRQFTGCSRLADYKMIKKLGEGTFGQVHKAVHIPTGEFVACKFILMHNEKEGFPVTALREIKILKSLSHENVIELSEMIIENYDKRLRKRANVYMVTPYMDHDLSGLIENPDVHFSISQIKCYMQQLLRGTAYLHSRQIMHRDMKSANLLIDNNGILKIADFGLARTFDEDPPTDVLPTNGKAKRPYTNCVVTRWYRPPELLLGDRKYTCAVDIWGIGCIFGEMYKTKPILPGTSDLNQIERIFKLCGTPTEETMPKLTELPGFNGEKKFGNHPRSLEEKFEKYGRDMLNLLSQLLVMDHTKRLTANLALHHQYFTNFPLPDHPSNLPKYEESHEIDKKKFRANKPNFEEGNIPKAPAGYSIAEVELDLHQFKHYKNVPPGPHFLWQTEERYTNSYYRDHHDSYMKRPYDRGPNADHPRLNQRDRYPDLHSYNNKISRQYDYYDKSPHREKVDPRYMKRYNTSYQSLEVHDYSTQNSMAPQSTRRNTFSLNPLDSKYRKDSHRLDYNSRGRRDWYEDQKLPAYEHGNHPLARRAIFEADYYMNEHSENGRRSPRRLSRMEFDSTRSHNLAERDSLKFTAQRESYARLRDYKNNDQRNAR